MPVINFNPQSRHCIICGSDLLRNFKAYPFDGNNTPFVNMVECKKCCFAWQYPVSRTNEQSVKYFESAFSNSNQNTNDYFNENFKRDISILELDFISTLPLKNKKLLDIGAGAGIFAEVAAENNWDVTAVDPAINLDRFNNNTQINAIKGTIDLIPNGELFDVITLWDVIEHVTDPIDLIYNSKRYLKNKGWLIIETGNYKCAGRINGGLNHWIYQLDHKWYFSPESIVQLLKKSGFSDFIFSDKVLRPGWTGSVGYIGPSKINLLKSVTKDPFHILNLLSKYHSLRKARGWDKAGIDIFTVAAK